MKNVSGLKTVLNIIAGFLLCMRGFSVRTSKRHEMVDITEKIQTIIDEEHFSDGIVIVYVPHTTAGVTINEGADPSVQHDILSTLKTMIPEQGGYAHSEGNSDAHIKASLIGASEMMVVENRKLVLGTWQHVFFYEGDGPRNRRVYVKLIASK
jgi:secondary thiamine-phosphate synthase enzyme